MHVRKQFMVLSSLSSRTGRIESLIDPQYGFPFLLSPDQISEISLNGIPLETKVESVEEGKQELLTILSAYLPIGYGCGISLMIRRMMTYRRKGYTFPSSSLHLRYEITRVENTQEDRLDYIWPPPLEAPFFLQTLSLNLLRTHLFGEKTHLRVLALGGTGPRDHVSLEDGSVDDVLPWVQKRFRTEFPGQLTVNGALYYHPDTEDWVWVLVRRPHVTGRIEWTHSTQSYHFGYYQDFSVGKEIFSPTISFFWGRGLNEADRTLAHLFDAYEEPPSWLWHTTWFWLHPAWTKGMDFFSSSQIVERLMDECGVNGLGILAHDIPLSGNDIDVGSMKPSPTLGGETGFRKLVQTIRQRDGHAYIWISRHGHRPDSLDYRPQWSIYGIDGRPIRLRNRPDSGVNLNIINPADPDFFAYITSWMSYYMDLGVDGFFWDSGFQPVPPDFGQKSYLQCPGETNARAIAFYEKVFRWGKKYNPNFFMWGEGISIDIPMHAYSVDSPQHGLHSGHQLMYKLAQLSSQRLVWRSAWPYDLASGWVMINPINDVGFSLDSYEKVIRDPMNQWICNLVKRIGVRNAKGIQPGVSQLNEWIIVSPGCGGKILIPNQKIQQVSHVLTGEKIEGELTEKGTFLSLTVAGAYCLEK